MRPWKDPGKSNLTLGLGLSLPTGSIKVRNNQGRLAEPALQPGTGAMAWLFEFSLRRFKKPNHLLGRQFAHFSVSSFFRLNTSGQSAYRFGNQWDLHLGGAYPIKAGVQLLGQFVSRWRDRDDAGRSGELTDATGGTWVYLSPGLQVDLLPGLAGYGFLQVPVYRNLNGVQLTADRNVLVGVRYDFYI